MKTVSFSVFLFILGTFIVSSGICMDSDDDHLLHCSVHCKTSCCMPAIISASFSVSSPAPARSLTADQFSFQTVYIHTLEHPPRNLS